MRRRSAYAAEATIPCANLLVLLAMIAVVLAIAAGLTYGAHRLHRWAGIAVGGLLGVCALPFLPLIFLAVVFSLDPASSFCQQDLLTGKPRVERR